MWFIKYPESKRLAQLFAQEKPHQLGNEERDDSIPQKALIPSIATQSHEPNRGVIEATTKTKHKQEIKFIVTKTIIKLHYIYIISTNYSICILNEI